MQTAPSSRASVLPLLLCYYATLLLSLVDCMIDSPIRTPIRSQLRIDKCLADKELTLLFARFALFHAP